MNFRYGATALFLRVRSPPCPGDQLYVLLNNGVLASDKVAIGEQVYHRQIGDGGCSAHLRPSATATFIARFRSVKNVYGDQVPLIAESR
jgi:hypothetical protein